MTNLFEHSKLLEPEQTLFDYLWDQPGRRQLCVSEDELQKIDNLRPHISRLSWIAQYRSYHSDRHKRVTVMIVSRWRYGWRVSRRFFDTKGYSFPLDLCYLGADAAVVFPSSAAAINAAEIFSSGQHWDVAPFVWINTTGEFRFCPDPNCPVATPRLMKPH
jgi:hypothetical protein